VLVVGSAIAVVAGASQKYDPNLDPVKVAPAEFTERLNNDKVRVVEYRSKPGAKEPMHSHPTLLLIVVNGGTYRTTSPDGKVTDTVYKGGEVLWRGPVTHSGENVGNTELHDFLIEVK
jgi:quercetin dioxygenase-like cupin family protein